MDQKISYQILKHFKFYYSDLTRKMMKTEHSFSLKESNPYHAEGNVWTHSMSVYSISSMMFPEDSELLYSSLLHDIGKPETREEGDDGKVRFFGHASLSMFKSIDILQDLDSEFSMNHLNVLEAIARHQDPYQKKEVIVENERMEKLLRRLSYSDSHGGISYLNNEDVNPIYKIKSGSGKEMKSPFIIVMVGLPYSGKSTFIRENINEDCVLISRDETMMEMFGDSKNYNETWKSLSKEDHKKIDESVSEVFREAIKNRKNIVVDRTNLSAKSRRKWLGQVPKEYYKEIIAILIGDKLTEKRMESRGDKFISEVVMLDMKRRFVWPTYNENVDNIHILVKKNERNQIEWAKDQL